MIRVAALSLGLALAACAPSASTPPPPPRAPLAPAPPRRKPVLVSAPGMRTMEGRASLIRQFNALRARELAVVLKPKISLEVIARIQAADQSAHNALDILCGSLNPPTEQVLSDATAALDALDATLDDSSQ